MITVDKSAGAGVEMYLCDINSVHVVRSLLDVIKEQFYSPHINALINSAGMHPTNSLTPMSELQVDTFRHIMRVNFKAPFFLMAAAAHSLTHGGRVINISSVQS